MHDVWAKLAPNVADDDAMRDWYAPIPGKGMPVVADPTDLDAVLGSLADACAASALLRQIEAFLKGLLYQVRLAGATANPGSSSGSKVDGPGTTADSKSGGLGGGDKVKIHGFETFAALATLKAASQPSMEALMAGWPVVAGPGPPSASELRAHFDRFDTAKAGSVPAEVLRLALDTFGDPN